MNTSAKRDVIDPHPVEFKEVIILGAGFTTQNMGVWALASSAIACVLHAWPRAQVRLLDYNLTPATYKVRHSGAVVSVELLNIRFSKNVFLRNNITWLILTVLLARIVPLQSLKSKIMNSNPCLKAISSADAVCSVAGGDSFSDIYGLSRLLYVSLPQMLVLLMGKPLVLLPQTLGPFKTVLAKGIARYILSHAETVCARDKQSLDEITSLVGKNPLRYKLSYDMAFALKPQSPEATRLLPLQKLTACRPLIGFNVSGLLYMGGYTRNNMFGLESDYPQLVRDIILYFIKQDAHVLLVPHVFGGLANPESDTFACEKIYRELEDVCHGQLHMIDDEYDHQEIKYVIGNCDFFIGSRMHACIAGLSQCVPAIGLAYSRKFKGVLGSIQMDELVLDLCELNERQVLASVRDIYNRRQVVRHQLELMMPKVRRSVLNLFADIGAD